MTYQPPRNVRRERDREIRRMQKAGWVLNPDYENAPFEEAVTFAGETYSLKHGFRKTGVVKTGKGAQQAFAPSLFPRRFATPAGVTEIPPFIRP